MAEIILVQVADGRQMIKRDVFSVIRIKISLDMCTFLAWMLCSCLLYTSDAADE